MYGPRQSKRLEYSDKGRLWCDFKFAPFALEQRRRRGLDPEDRHHASVLVEALEASIQLDKFPKAVLEAYVVVLENEGGLMGAAISCASLALADAGVEMYDMVAACSAACIGSQVLLDPSLIEERAVRAQAQSREPSANEVSAGEASSSASEACTVLLAYMPALNQVTYVLQTGSAEEKTVCTMLKACQDGCKKLLNVMRECLVNATTKRLKREAQLKAKLSQAGPQRPQR